MMRDEEKDGREKLSTSPSLLGWLVPHWFASFLTQAPTAQTTSSIFSQVTPDPGPRNTTPAVAKLWITALPSFASQLLHQLNNCFFELWSLLETPEGVSVVLLRS